MKRAINRQLVNLFAAVGIFLTISPQAQAQAGTIELRTLNPIEATVRSDFDLILNNAHLATAIDFSVVPDSKTQVEVLCDSETVHLRVSGSADWSQAFYMSLRHLGFLFPHPRQQISPSLQQVRSHCGKTYLWRPATKYSGFHFHTMHPSEWVHGFLMGQTDIAYETVRWLARNQQNVFDLSLLDMKENVMFTNLKGPFQLAKEFGIHAGVGVGMTFRQQHSYRLISRAYSVSELLSMRQLQSKLARLFNQIDISFINLEMGANEFMPSDYDLTLKWMNKISELAADRGISTFVKIHTSTGQSNKKYGNFNFLPQFASPLVGILPHTVFLYGVEDKSAPMYGNTNFQSIGEFMLKQKQFRRTWFYPETSYFCALDIDVPLFFTNYLTARAHDTEFLYRNGVEGQLNFSTGQEMGYWLFDWTYTLLNDLDNKFDPMSGLALLGENTEEWQKIVDYQNEYFINKGLVSILTFSSFSDELLSGKFQTLSRNLLKKLAQDPAKLKQEISALQEAIQNRPSTVDFHTRDLALMWEITSLRIDHALHTRLALLNSADKESELAKAAEFRHRAQIDMNEIMSKFGRYPEAQTFEKHNNPTAYKWGYAFPASNLHFWLREEEEVRRSNYSPFFMSLFTLRELIEGWLL